MIVFIVNGLDVIKLNSAVSVTKLAGQRVATNKETAIEIERNWGAQFDITMVNQRILEDEAHD